jgi:putative hydrolase of the HAD superfamily
MMKAKAIVFDYGGVICFPPSPDNEAELARLTGLSVTALRELNRKYRGELDRGTYNTREFYRYVLSGEGIFPDEDTLEQIARVDMEGWMQVNPATVQLMRDIKNSGLTLGILSNMSPEFLAWASEAVPVMGEADVAVYSSTYNVVKPETAIYEILREQLGCEYGEIVFFDDTADNIAKAAELGIRGFVWEGPEIARERIASL